MRELFGSWGARLDDDAFDAAVAARLVELGYVKSETERFASLDAALEALATGAGLFRFADWASVKARWDGSASSPDALAAAWRRIQDARPRIVTPELEPARGADASFALAVLECIGRRSTGTASVVASFAPRGDALGEWQWPLRIGVLPAERANEIARALAPHRFVRVSPALEESRDWDILCLPTPLKDAVTTPGLGKTRTRVVFLCGSDAGVEASRVPAALTKLQKQVGAETCVLGRAPESEAGSVLRSILDGVAHDVRFDEAVFEVLRDGDRVPIVSSNLGFLDSTRDSARRAGIRDLPASVGPDEPPRLPANGARPRKKKKKKTKKRSARRDPGSEAPSPQVLPDAAAPEADPALPRFLQTGARKKGSADTTPFATSLRSGVTYELGVWIGPRETGALGLDVEFPTLEDPDEEHELVVVLSEPSLFDAPQVSKVVLPPVGRSNTCRFVFRCHARLKRIEARITVLHRGRVLQTGVLRGKILKRDEKETRSAKLSFALDAAPRRHLLALNARSSFGAALVANHKEDGKARTTAVAGGFAADIKLGDAALNAVVAAFDSTISKIADTPEDYAKLRSKGTLELLLKLARHGARLHEVIAKHNPVGPEIIGSDRIQIVTASEDGFLPLELAYRYTAPGADAKLCKGAETALKKGKCPASCGKDRGTGARLCPLGFWGLSKTIERFAHLPEHTQMNADFGLRVEPTTKRARIPRPKRGVVAGSARATAADKQALKRVEAAVKSHATLSSAKDWKDWTKQVSKNHPGLLVLIPHHTAEDSESILEIGKASQLEATLVTKAHVVGEPETSPPPRPIVLILGCETQDSPIAFERFPSVFADRGAAIVVGTIATVLGRHASPAAVDLIDELFRSSSRPRSFGDLLLEARRKLLTKGRAMCLALVGFGDADWLID